MTAWRYSSIATMENGWLGVATDRHQSGVSPRATDEEKIRADLSAERSRGRSSAPMKRL
jgi:hypothetical protein